MNSRRERTLRDRSIYAYWAVSLSTVIIVAVMHTLVWPAFIEIILSAVAYAGVYWVADKILFRPSKDD